MVNYLISFGVFWLTLYVALVITAHINVIVESIKQKKKPNTIVREWADEYIPKIQKKADNFKNNFFGN